MGCWNGTCAVTGLPVYWQNEVEVILLKTEIPFDDGSFCDQYSYHAPLPLTFSGEYNDYGAVENCHGAGLNTIIESLRKSMIEYDEDDERRRFEGGIKREDFDIEMLFNLDHESLLYVKTFGQMQHDMREKHRVSHITVHKHVYDSIVSTLGFETWRKKDNGEFETLEINLESYRAEYAQYIKDIDDMIADEDDIMRRFKFDLDGCVGKTMVGKIMGERGHGTYALQYPIRLANLLVEMREKNEDITDILDNAVKFYVFNIFMSQARRSWHKPSGSGSQDSETDAQVLAAKLTIEVAAMQKKYWDEI